MTNVLRDALQGFAGRVGYTGKQIWKLGRGDGSGTVQNTNDPFPRMVWIYRDQAGEGREISTAVLDASSGIMWANIAALENTEVQVVYPPLEARRHVIGLSPQTGMASVGSMTPLEQALQAAAIPPAGNLATMRVDPSSYTLPTLICNTTAFFYIQPSTRLLKYQPTSTLDFTSTVGAIASGKHRYAWATYDYESGAWGITSSADQTPSVALPSRGDFTGATFASLVVANTAKRAAAVYLYFGQPGVAEADFYRALDARLDFPLASEFNSIAGGWLSNVRVVTAAGAVTVATTDFIVEVNKSVGAATTVNLPATTVTGTLFVIKDGKGDAGTNNITVTPAAGTIDGAATFVMNVNYQSALITYDGTQWRVLAGNGSGGGGSGTVTSVTAGDGLEASPNPIVGAGTLKATGAFKAIARVVAVANVNTANPGTAVFDGITLANGDRMLLTAQSALNQNGLWVFNGSGVALTRPADFASGDTGQCLYSMVVKVMAGTTYASTEWFESATGAITIDTTSQTWLEMPTPVGSGRVTGLLPSANLATALTGHTWDNGAIGASIPSTGIFSLLAADSIAFKVLNGSGATANANDVGYLDYDATNGYVYKTTTTANLDGVAWCVVTNGGGNGANIDVARRGQVTVKLNANCSIGNFLLTSTTAGQASVSTTMRPEVFAVALSANSGGAGGTCIAMLLCSSRYVPATNANALYAVSNSSSTAFVSTINGAPSATSVVYGAVTSGAANTIVPNAAGQLLKARLWNTTRNSYRLISSVNTGTSTITTVSSTDTWANGDAITIESRTVTTGLAWKEVDLDFSQQSAVPTLARAVVIISNLTDSAGNAQLTLHPFLAYSNNSTLPNATEVAAKYSFMTVTVPIYSGVIDNGTNAAGSGTAIPTLQLAGYILAEP